MSDTYSHTLLYRNFNGATRLTPVGHNVFDKNMIETFEHRVAKPELPYLLYTGNKKIEQLEKLKLTDDVAAQLNNSELSIYLAEPLCLYNSTLSTRNRLNFYDEFHCNVPKNALRSDEIDSIAQFAQLNNLTHIVVYTCETNTSALKKSYPNLSFFCYDVFIRSFAEPNMAITEISNKITNTFCSANWRFTPHRHLIMSHLHNKSGKFGWGFNLEGNAIALYPWFDVTLIELDKFKTLLNNASSLTPTSLDLKITPTTVEHTGVTAYPIQVDGTPTNPHNLMAIMKECFCGIVCESRFAIPFGTISEKVLYTINASIPFIIVAPPYSLKYMQQLGFKTFNKWWDESYDTDENHTTRLLKIFDIIDMLNTKSIQELTNMHNEMKEVLRHNLEIFKNLKDCKRILN